MWIHQKKKKYALRLCLTQPAWILPHCVPHPTSSGTWWTSLGGLLLRCLHQTRLISTSRTSHGPSSSWAMTHPSPGTSPPWLSVVHERIFLLSPPPPQINHILHWNPSGILKPPSWTPQPSKGRDGFPGWEGTCAVVQRTPMHLWNHQAMALGAGGRCQLFSPLPLPGGGFHLLLSVVPGSLAELGAEATSMVTCVSSAWFALHQLWGGEQERHQGRWRTWGGLALLCCQSLSHPEAVSSSLLLFSVYGICCSLQPRPWEGCLLFLALSHNPM